MARPPQAQDAAAITRRPRFHPVKLKSHDFAHCFSVCLYHEPEYAMRFPTRDFNARYLSRADEVRRHLEEIRFDLNIFACPRMVETALALDIGSVYLVSDPPPFPFAQQVWRYYSAMLPDHGPALAYHFRGMDNLILSPEEESLMAEFLDSGGEIMHTPYLRRRGDRYMPIRGSCSTAGDAIASLGRYLATAPHELEGEWPDQWHNDELHLGRWFNAVKRQSHLFTLVDRELPMEFYADVHEQVKSGKPFRLIRTFKAARSQPTP